jgi:hypothetical protein
LQKKDNNQAVYHEIKAVMGWNVVIYIKRRTRIEGGLRTLLRRIFGPKGEAGEKCVVKSFIICSIHQIFLEYLDRLQHF